MTGSKKSTRSLLLAALAVGVATAPAGLGARTLPGELAEKDGAIVLKPLSAWQLDAGADRCTLARKFSSEDGPGLLAYEQFAPGSRFDVTMAAPDLASARRGAWFYGGMRNDWPLITIEPIEFDLPGYGDAATLAGAALEEEPEDTPSGKPLAATAIDLNAAEMSDRLVLQRTTRIVSFETGNMRAPFEALNACSAELLGDWGLSPFEDDHYTPAAMPNPRTYFARLNRELLRAKKLSGDGALVRLRARVEADGSVSQCKFETLAAGQSDIPDICAEISEMQFEPALNKEGEAFPSLFTLSIRLSPYGAWNSGAHGGRWGG
ncbi:hypothetical protein [Erythrobacter sp. SD-21]|uniref:hypothetical protein n=1 Tax=Erythrobacter sp. SD-21 TaxID=161528 RepID=UPI000153F489|nr:hypothetical protein [Erythrobacter sp. SD-21]EDL49876.1 hypothetical protein ED21_19797 [Erythrobacter sp. SD-21]